MLIGFPGSGKSETSNTLIGKRDFKAELQNVGQTLHQEVNSVFGDLHVSVRDIHSFESLNEFVDIYNSLIDLECRKVVFGLTIGIGRLPTGYTDTLKSLFKDNGIGQHLTRRTFVIFTKVDELLRYDEVSYKDKFDKWLRDAEQINQLIISLKLRYCVIQNKLSGEKRLQQAYLVMQPLKCILQDGNEQETWSEVNSTYDGLTKSGDDNNETRLFSKFMEKEFKINLSQAQCWIKLLKIEKDRNRKLEILNRFLISYEIETTQSNRDNAERLLREFESDEKEIESDEGQRDKKSFLKLCAVIYNYLSK